MKTQMVFLQADLDSGKVSVSLQEKIMKRIFGMNTSTSYGSMNIGQLYSYAGKLL